MYITWLIGIERTCSIVLFTHGEQRCVTTLKSSLDTHGGVEVSGPIGKIVHCTGDIGDPELYYLHHCISLYIFTSMKDESSCNDNLVWLRDWERGSPRVVSTSIVSHVLIVRISFLALGCRRRWRTWIGSSPPLVHLTSRCLLGQEVINEHMMPHQGDYPDVVHQWSVACGLQ